MFNCFCAIFHLQHLSSFDFDTRVTQAHLSNALSGTWPLDVSVLLAHAKGVQREWKTRWTAALLVHRRRQRSLSDIVTRWSCSTRVSRRLRAAARLSQYLRRQAGRQFLRGWTRRMRAVSQLAARLRHLAGTRFVQDLGWTPPGLVRRRLLEERRRRQSRGSAWATLLRAYAARRQEVRSRLVRVVRRQISLNRRERIAKLMLNMPIPMPYSLDARTFAIQPTSVGREVNIRTTIAHGRVSISIRPAGELVEITQLGGLTSTCVRQFSDAICLPLDCVTAEPCADTQPSWALMASAFPHCKSAPGRTAKEVGLRSLAHESEWSRPGTVVTWEAPDGVECPLVVGVCGQWAAGRPRKSIQPPPYLGADKLADRVRWFEAGLQSLGDVVRSRGLRTVAFPHGLDCGVNGGNWEHYRALLQQFAHCHPGLRVLLVHEQQDLRAKLQDDIRASSQAARVWLHEHAEGMTLALGIALTTQLESNLLESVEVAGEDPVGARVNVADVFATSAFGLLPAASEAQAELDQEIARAKQAVRDENESYNTVYREQLLAGLRSGDLSTEDVLDASAQGAVLANTAHVVSSNTHGNRVELHGLVDRVGLNGIRGIVLGESDDRSRLCVRVDRESRCRLPVALQFAGIVNVRPANVMLVRNDSQGL